jgi:hypothetical protein
MRGTRYICYHGENKIHLLSWGEQDTFFIMGRTRYIWWDDNDVCFVLDQHSELDFNSASSLKQESAVISNLTTGGVIALYVVDLGSSPGQVKPKTITLVFIASLLSSTKK